VFGSRSRAFLEGAGAVKKNYREPELVKTAPRSRAFFEDFEAGKILLKRIPGAGASEKKRFWLPNTILNKRKVLYISTFLYLCIQNIL